MEVQLNKSWDIQAIEILVQRALRLLSKGFVYHKGLRVQGQKSKNAVTRDLSLPIKVAAE